MSELSSSANAESYPSLENAADADIDYEEVGWVVKWPGEMSFKHLPVSHKQADTHLLVQAWVVRNGLFTDEKMISVVPKKTKALILPSESHKMWAFVMNKEGKVKSLSQVTCPHKANLISQGSGTVAKDERSDSERLKICEQKLAEATELLRLIVISVNSKQ